MKKQPIAAPLPLELGSAAPASADMKSVVTAAYSAWDAAFNKGDARPLPRSTRLRPSSWRLITFFGLGRLTWRRSSPDYSRTGSRAISLSRCVRGHSEAAGGELWRSRRVHWTSYFRDAIHSKD